MSTLSMTRNLVAVPLMVGTLVGSLTVSEPAYADVVVEDAVAAAAVAEPTPSFTLSKRVVIGARASLPLSSYRLTGRFGQSSGLWARTHTGLDFAAPYGSPIRSVVNGVVVSTGSDGAYGTKTVIRDEDGREWWYCHQSTVAVAVGQAVTAGDVIGAVGSTGNSTGPHLHLEIRPSEDTPVDPLTVLAGLGLRP